MTGISLPDDATKANMDASTDDPKLARAELADLVDKFNSLKDEIGSDRLQWNIELPGVAYASSTSFTTTDTAACHVGRRVQVVGSTTGTVYATIDSVSGSTITLTGITDSTGASATLSNETLTAWVSVLSADPASAALEYYPIQEGESGVTYPTYPVGNILRYGAVADYDTATETGTDNLAAIQAALDFSNTVYVPAGSYLVSDALQMDGNQQITGDGRENSKIYRISGDGPVLKLTDAGTATRTLNVSLEGIRFTGHIGMTTRVVDFRGVSYARLTDVQILGDNEGDSSDVSGTANDAIGLDVSPGLTSFCGYVTLTHCFISFCDIGLNGQINDVVIDGGSYNSNKTRGIVFTGGANVSIRDAEATANGRGSTATYTGTYPDGKYDKGGILLDNVFGGEIVNVWCENNAVRSGTLFSPNDIEVLDNCTHVRSHSNRVPPSNDGPIFMRAGSNGVEFASGFGPQQHSATGLLPNGQFIYRDASDVPLGWSTTGTITWADASSLPTGVRGIRISASDLSEAPRMWRVILTAAECAAMAGKVISMTFWAMAVTDPWPGSGVCRTGLSLSASGLMSSGSFIDMADAPGEPVLMSMRHTLDGTETNGLRAGVLMTGTATAGVFEMGDVSVTIGEVPFIAYEQTITSAGGTLHGPLTVPTFADNTAATTGGLTAGQVYQTSTGELRIVV